MLAVAAIVFPLYAVATASILKGEWVKFLFVFVLLVFSICANGIDAQQRASVNALKGLCSGGNSEACYSLGLYYYKENIIKTASYFFIKACNDGHQQACVFHYDNIESKATPTQKATSKAPTQDDAEVLGKMIGYLIMIFFVSFFISGLILGKTKKRLERQKKITEAKERLKIEQEAKRQLEEEKKDAA